MIHKTAIIDKGAEIAKGVSVGPYAGIEKGERFAKLVGAPAEQDQCSVMNKSERPGAIY